MTASKIVLDRADFKDENMGLKTIKGSLPTKQEAQVGKNYLNQEELYRLFLISEQFLLFAESTALRKEKMTMSELHGRLDKLLEINKYPVFSGYKDRLKDEMLQHVEREYEQYLEIKKLELLGISVDFELFLEGEYDEYKEETNQITRQQIEKKIEEEISRKLERLSSDQVLLTST